ncbi:tol-pal system YbgF family protein, partial [Candidatus Poribacteria bacterium]
VDLQSRQKVLEMLKPAPQPDTIPQKIEDDFAWNVYRRIARDAMHQRSRRIRTRRFVLQPAFAAVALATVLVIGVIQFHPGDSPIQKLPHIAAADRDAQAELKVKELRDEFLARQGMIPENESSYLTTDNVSNTYRSSSDVDHRVQDALLPDSRRRLEYASFIYYSLGDRKRALAEYRQLVDYYPGTDVAEEAQGRIRAISGMEYGIQVEDVSEERIADMGI